jgi:outer membrane protein assembly factor BamD (BamD/ComL family)
MTMRPSNSLALLLAATLCACASKRSGTPDDEPTLKTLAGREVEVAPDAGITGGPAQTIAAYNKFLEIAPKAPQRSEAMRRLGDLEMDVADDKAADGQGTASGAPDYKAAIARYQDYLKAYPKDPGNDRVLYQLSRAHEQGGDLETALKTLDRLVADYPQTSHADEAQFRRGELLFTTGDYAKAEKAYAAVLGSGADNPYQDRALYMQGWAQFKQGRLEDALHSFFGVLDLKIAGRDGEAALDSIEGLTRAERELVEDTFRVTSLSLANLQGAESINPYITDDKRKSYEFRVYQQLGELYLKQERTKDAADTLGLFARRQPLHAQAPQLQARVIDIYQQTGFPMLALEAKKEYVSNYGVDSEFRKANPAGWEKAQPLVKTHLTELARHFHATAQKSKSSADYQEAVRWYRMYIASFPNDPATPQNNFLLAELLYEDSRFGEAAVEYEKTAYGYPKHTKSADAGYAALLSYTGQEKRTTGAEQVTVQRAGVESSLRFAKAFPEDLRTAQVLTTAAEKLYALRDGERATGVARQVLALNPPATDAQRRVAWTVVAHTAFEKGAFAESEKSYGEVIALTGERDAARTDLVERLAASVYKQGEQARAAGQRADAVGHFARVAAVAPQSTVRATAQYDAAAEQIAMKDWDGAARTLEDFRGRFPNHPLQGEVGGKLAVAYLEKGNWAQAAGELERIAVAPRTDPKVARDAQWQAAELYEKGGSRAAAAKAYDRYLKQYPQPLVPAIEARWRLATIAKADGDTKREAALMKEIHQADLMGGSARTDRTRTLGGLAALSMTEPALAAYRKVTLVEPLARNLKLKKARMEEVLKAYAAASEYRVPEVTTAATFRTASLYQDFGRAMLTSQRPKSLKRAELEQYNVMLEEQAFPFEEKAIELHEVNAKRASEGIYDEWVRSSFKALAELRPVRYGKNERSEGVIDAIR